MGRGTECRGQGETLHGYCKQSTRQNARLKQDIWKLEESTKKDFVSENFQMMNYSEKQKFISMLCVHTLIPKYSWIINSYKIN